MKSVLLLMLTVALAGCGTLPTGEAGIVQQMLNAALPRGFTGDFFIGHSNPYFKGSIRAGNLRWGTYGWEFDWLVYERDGWGSHGTIRLGSVPTQ